MVVAYDYLVFLNFIANSCAPNEVFVYTNSDISHCETHSDSIYDFCSKQCTVLSFYSNVMRANFLQYKEKC